VQEKEIIKLLLERQQQGMEELLLHYGPLMRYVISPILESSEDREECLSEAAMKIWENIESYDEDRGNWTAWITAISRNAALDRVRKRKYVNLAEDLSEEFPSQEKTPEEIVLQKERQENLLKVLQNLPRQERLLFYRKYYYMQSTAQIASELGMSERAVEGKLYRLKKRLQKQLGGEVYE